MNDMKIFTNTEFGELSVLVVDGKEMFPATECARILGYTDPYDAINRHTKGSVKHRVLTVGGEQEIKFIPEGDLYRLIIRSKLPAAEKFERWVFDDVIPTIRRHGTYATQQLLDNPDVWIEALTQLKVEREKRHVLELENVQSKQIIGELMPKACYYDTILQNKSVMPMSTIAKDYGMSARRLNALLHDLGIQFKMGDRWFLYQKYANYGYTHSQPHLINEHHSVMHMFWTQKGRLFLYDFLKNKCGILPAIECSEVFERGETSWV